MDYNNKLQPVKEKEKPKKEEVDIEDWITWDGKEKKPENNKPTITYMKNKKRVGK